MSSREQFELIALPLRNDLFFAALALTHNEHDAVDLVQDTYVKALRSFSAFRPTGGGIKAWLFTILRHAYIDRCRARRETPVPLNELDLPISSPDAVDLPIHEFLSDDLLRALRSLSAKHQLLLLLADIEGLAYKEISEALGCPIGSVMSGLYHARAGLRRALAPRSGAPRHG